MGKTYKRYKELTEKGEKEMNYKGKRKGSKKRKGCK